jgi:succinate dehydrogenase flavin-adding protein (antitoxin of CptAB toxin-antitoxin module)
LAALAAVAVVSCTGSAQSHASPSPVASVSPIAANPAESKAADFRIRLDLLLGEHVMIIAKQSSAPARQAEYTGYLRLLTANSSDLTELVRSALGDSVATRFEQLWNAQNDDLVNYTIGLVTHNKAKADAAISLLSDTFVPQFSQFLNDVTQIPSELIVPLVTQHMLETKSMLDDQLAGNYPGLYADIRTSYAHATQVGDAIAPRITGTFPDKFPGNATSSAVDLRASLNIRLQEHSYLATMRTSADAGHRAAEQAAAAGALVANTNALDAQITDLFGATPALRFDQLWSAANAAMVGYALASISTSKQRALSQLTDASVTQLGAWLTDTTDLPADASRPVLEAQLEAVVTVIDDQRTRSWSKLAADDRWAAASAEVVADLITAAAIAKLRPKFG